MSKKEQFLFNRNKRNVTFTKQLYNIHPVFKYFYIQIADKFCELYSLSTRRH